MEYNIKSLIAPALFTAILAFSAYAIPTYAQSTETNQSLQDAGEMANQTGEAVQGNASELGANITQGAANVVENIGEGLANLTK
jgi:hypothetical protein